MALLSSSSIFLLLCAFLLSPCGARSSHLSQPPSSILITPIGKDWIGENPSGDSEVVSKSHENAREEQAAAIAPLRKLMGNEKAINETNSNGTSKGQLQMESPPVETQGNNKTENGDKHTSPVNEKGSSNSTGIPLSPILDNNTRPGVNKDVNNSSSPEKKKPEKDTNKTGEAKKSNECKESQCQDVSKVVTACLRTSGADASDGNTLFLLTISNDGDNNVTVTVVAPYFLTAKPPKVLVKNGTIETVHFYPKTAPKGLDSEGANNTSITITFTTAPGECKIGVPNTYLPGDAAQQKSSEPFLYSSFITPMAGVYLLFIVLVMVAGITLLCKYYGRKQPGDGVKYQELEMNVPGVGTPKEKVGKLGEESTDGWDEIWDDDWEDAEAARSSARLSQNLSSRGLAARRGNKDGWDNSWDD